MRTIDFLFLLRYKIVLTRARAGYFGKNIFLFFVFLLLWTIHSLNPFHISEHDYSLTHPFYGKNKNGKQFSPFAIFLLGVSIIDPSYEVMPDKTSPVEGCPQVYTFINQFVWKRPASSHAHNLILASFQS